ncbi:hypothetical protein GCM10025859_66200 [Alicyclobacillus fastidiosus]|nr:hypothetical protein GCM10025859_64000 [Alicyclobacillus fastidiosus]GMA66178.1 hypothetical protein GCM10025859_66200 [Alicyclobacillus fastidiosus]
MSVDEATKFIDEVLGEAENEPQRNPKYYLNDVAQARKRYYKLGNQLRQSSYPQLDLTEY